MLKPSAAQVASEQEIRVYLLKLLACFLNVPADALAEEESFFSLGLNSLIHAEVLARLMDTFGELSSTVLFEYPNLTLLAEHLAERRPLRAALDVTGKGHLPDLL